MKLKYKIILLLCFGILILLVNSKDVEAKSYSIEDMDMQVYVLEDGSAQIKHFLTYKFDGEYNGIYMTVPFNLNDAEKDASNSKSQLGDSLYNGKNVIFNNVFEINNGVNTEYKYIMYGSNGDTGKYELDRYDDYEKIKIYSHTYGGIKKFEVDYTIKDLCVKHKDVAELYYNFIGGKWDEDIKNLNIDIYLPENNQNIKIWGHGPLNGESKMISNVHANFKVKNIKKGEYVATRVMFDREAIATATKLSNVYATDIILLEEENIFENREKRNEYTKNMWIVGVCLLIYWIILIRIFEKDKKYILPHVNEEELFKKYNPMIAGCIQGNRNLLARDIVAVLLNLINKKNIKLDIENTSKGGYNYILTKVPENEDKMDELEKYVYEWFFGNVEVRDFKGRLEDIPQRGDANGRFKELSKRVNQELAKIKANETSVPFWVRGLNIGLFVIVIALVIKHIILNVAVLTEKDRVLTIAYMIPVITLMPGIIFVFANIIIMIRHKINKVVQRINGQRIVTTTITIVLIFGILMLITALIAPDIFLIADEFVIGMATIIILTDNLMLKNNAVMIEDFSKLNTLKLKIQNNTLINEKDVGHVILWEKYLCYAISFGISQKIINRLSGLYLDDDLELLMFKDVNIKKLILSDYYRFYKYASTDKVYMNRISSAIGKNLRRKWKRPEAVVFPVVGDFLVEVEVAGGRRSLLT